MSIDARSANDLEEIACRSLRLITTLTVLIPSALAAQDHVVFFDTQALGTNDFQEAAANFFDGEVATFGIPEFYASGSQMYWINDGVATVTFDEPIDSVDFFFVHGQQVPQGTATAFDASDNPLGSVRATSPPCSATRRTSRRWTSRRRSPGSRITDGVIDNFGYTIDPVPVDLRSFDVE